MKMKKLIALGAAAAMTLSFAMTAYAGKWVEGMDGEKMYQLDNNTYATDSWQTIGGKDYYFDADGYLLIDGVAPDGNRVDCNGVWMDPENDGIPEAEDAIEYNGHAYTLMYLKAVDWDSLETYCETLGGHLATITSKGENDALYNYVKSRGFKDTDVYFGFTDEVTEKNWKWVTGEKSSYTNWNKGEPSNSKGVENYAAFYHKYSTGVWNDVSFAPDAETGSTYKAFLCEWQ